VTRTRHHLIVGALAVLAFLGALGAVHLTRQPAPAHPAATPAAAIRTSFPDLPPAPDEPALNSLAGLSPAPGEVVQAPGPFDDRLQIDGLRLDAAGVSGSVLVVSDVSEVLEFSAVAGFYDADGRLLDTGRFPYHLDETAHDPAEEHGPPDELEQFTIPVPAGVQDRAVSAAVGVPVLVNE